MDKSKVINAGVGLLLTLVFVCLIAGALSFVVIDELRKLSTLALVVIVLTVIGAVLGTAALMAALNIFTVKRTVEVSIDAASKQTTQSIQSQEQVIKALAAYVVGRNQGEMQAAPAQLPAPHGIHLDPPHFTRQPDGAYINSQVVVEDAQRIYRELAALGLACSRANIQRVTGITSHERQDRAKERLVEWGVLLPGTKGAAPRFADTDGRAEADDWQ